MAPRSTRTKSKPYTRKTRVPHATEAGLHSCSSTRSWPQRARVLERVVVLWPFFMSSCSLPTRLAAPSPSRVSPRSGTAKGGYEHYRCYQRHRAGAGELCGPCSGPLARRPGTWRPHTAPRPRLAGQNRRRRVGTLYGAPGLAEGGLGGAGWLGRPPRAVRQASGVGETISGRRGGGSDARSGCWPEDVAGSAILGAPGASSRDERRQLVAGAAGRSGQHRMLVGVGCLGV